MNANTEAVILERLIKPERNTLSPEAARSILRLKFRDSDHERMNKLAALARAGALSANERAELDEYRRVGHLLALLHSKARLTLKKNKRAAPKRKQ